MTTTTTTARGKRERERGKQRERAIRQQPFEILGARLFRRKRVRDREMLRGRFPKFLARDRNTTDITVSPVTPRVAVVAVDDVLRSKSRWNSTRDIRQADDSTRRAQRDLREFP